jgi:hypothetical protein
VLLGENFRELRYTTEAGLGVSASMEGALFSMEDQRNYADSSYKAYAPLGYAYPEVTAEARREQVFRLAVEGAREIGAPDPLEVTEPVVTRVHLGNLAEGAKIPKVHRSVPATREADFFSVNTQRHLHADAESVQFACNPALHLPDDDTVMENVGAVLDQVRTARSFAPRAKIRIDPITFNSQHPRPGSDPRNATVFGAAWSAALMKYLALAGVDGAGFAVDGPAAREIQEEIGAFAGCGVFEATTEAVVRPAVEAIAVSTTDSIRLWLINMTDCPQRAVVVREGSVLLPPTNLAPHEVLARELR